MIITVHQRTSYGVRYNLADGDFSRRDYRRVASALRRGAATISAPGAWCTGALARRADTADSDPRAAEATQWCALGAAIKALHDTGKKYSDAEMGLLYRFGIYVDPHKDRTVGMGVYNDLVARGAGDVAAVMLQCAEALEAL